MTNSKKKIIQFNGEELITDILEIMPESTEIFTMHGLACTHCVISSQESLRHGILAHGFSEKNLKQIINDLNEAAEDLGIKQ